MSEKPWPNVGLSAARDRTRRAVALKCMASRSASVGFLVCVALAACANEAVDPTAADEVGEGDGDEPDPLGKEIESCEDPGFSHGALHRVIDPEPIDIVCDEGWGSVEIGREPLDVFKVPVHFDQGSWALRSGDEAWMLHDGTLRRVHADGTWTEAQVSVTNGELEIAGDRVFVATLDVVSNSPDDYVFTPGIAAYDLDFAALWSDAWVEASYDLDQLIESGSGGILTEFVVDGDTLLAAAGPQAVRYRFDGTRESTWTSETRVSPISHRDGVGWLIDDQGSVLQWPDAADPFIRFQLDPPLGSLAFDASLLFVAGQEHYEMSALSTSGILLWSHRHQRVEAPVLDVIWRPSIVAHPEGGFVVAGAEPYWGATIDDPPGTDNIPYECTEQPWIARVDADGSVRWRSRLDTCGRHTGLEIADDGTIWTKGTSTRLSPRGYDVWLARWAP